MKPVISALVATAVLAATGAPAIADARNSERSAHPHYAAQPSDGLSEQQVCKEEAFEADPSGQYAGYPCWARKAFAPRR